MKDEIEEQLLKETEGEGQDELWKNYNKDEYKSKLSQHYQTTIKCAEDELVFLEELIKLNKPVKELENEKGSVFYWNDKIACSISNRIKELKQTIQNYKKKLKDLK